MIKSDKKGNITGFICTKEDIDYTNFDKETLDYYENFLIPSYEDTIKQAIEYLHCLKSTDYIDINIVIKELLNILE